MKKILIKLTIKLLEWVQSKDFGEYDKVFDGAIDKVILKLKSYLEVKK